MNGQHKPEPFVGQRAPGDMTGATPAYVAADGEQLGVPSDAVFPA